MSLGLSSAKGLFTAQAAQLIAVQEAERERTQRVLSPRPSRDDQANLDRAQARRERRRAKNLAFKARQTTTHP